MCGDLNLAWHVHQIPYYAEAKNGENHEVGNIMMACEKCIKEKQLTPLDNEGSLHFDASNLAIKEIIETKREQDKNQ